MFNVETDKGFGSARVNGIYMDAGRAGNIAGIEFSVDNMRMFDQPREQRHADAVLTLDCTPQVLLQIATVILDKLELPAFNEREWREISSALRAYHASNMTEYADKIDAAAAKIANL
jgi:hypothetical protein